MFFVRYADSASTIALRASPVNLGHPLVQWYVANARTLQLEVPVAFTRIFKAFDDYRSTSVLHPIQTSGPRSLNVIKGALDQIAKARPNLAAPIEAYPTRSDEKGIW